MGYPNHDSVLIDEVGELRSEGDRLTELLWPALQYQWHIDGRESLIIRYDHERDITFLSIQSEGKLKAKLSIEGKLQPWEQLLNEWGQRYTIDLAELWFCLEVREDWLNSRH